MLSIDQNCHSLWDTIPKLQAVARRERGIVHWVEDVDVAYTSLGASVGEQQLQLIRERYHWSGGADWGAALFYSDFLGKQVMDPRTWEPYTGRKTKVLARQLGLSLEAFYDQYSPGDNWQLVGSSYVGDKQHHQVLRDLQVDPVAPFLRELLRHAMEDLTERFPEKASRERIEGWFHREAALLEKLLSDHAPQALVELYESWVRHHVPNGADVRCSSEGFSCRKPMVDDGVLNLFLREYETLCRLYNDSIEETEVSVRPLDVKRGEMPCFAMKRFQGHWVRIPVFLEEDVLRVDDETFPVGTSRTMPRMEMSQAGIKALSPKAILLVIQVRWGETGQPLILPYQGSLYTPASDRFLLKLREENLLQTPIHPILRVRFHLFERMRGLNTLVRLPSHWVPHFGESEITADALSRGFFPAKEKARERLERRKNPEERERCSRESFPQLWEAVQELERKKQELGKQGAPKSEKREVWEDLKAKNEALLQKEAFQIYTDLQLLEMDYWDSRGGLMPWCIALGGESFYRDVLDRSELYQEYPFAEEEVSS